MEHTKVAETAHDRFMRAGETEMTKFERQEVELRKKDREERAAKLKISLPKDSH